MRKANAFFFSEYLRKKNVAMQCMCDNHPQLQEICGLAIRRADIMETGYGPYFRRMFLQGGARPLPNEDANEYAQRMAQLPNQDNTDWNYTTSIQIINAFKEVPNDQRQGLTPATVMKAAMLAVRDRGQYGAQVQQQQQQDEPVSIDDQLQNMRAQFKRDTPAVNEWNLTPRISDRDGITRVCDPSMQEDSRFRSISTFGDFCIGTCDVESTKMTVGRWKGRPFTGDRCPTNDAVMVYDPGQGHFPTNATFQWLLSYLTTEEWSITTAHPRNCNCRRHHRGRKLRMLTVSNDGAVELSDGRNRMPAWRLWQIFNMQIWPVLMRDRVRNIDRMCELFQEKFIEWTSFTNSRAVRANNPNHILRFMYTDGVLNSTSNPRTPLHEACRALYREMRRNGRRWYNYERSPIYRLGEFLRGNGDGLSGPPPGSFTYRDPTTREDATIPYSELLLPFLYWWIVDFITESHSKDFMNNLLPARTQVTLDDPDRAPALRDASLSIANTDMDFHNPSGRVYVVDVEDPGEGYTSNHKVSVAFSRIDQSPNRGYAHVRMPYLFVNVASGRVVDPVQPVYRHTCGYRMCMYHFLSHLKDSLHPGRTSFTTNPYMGCTIPCANPNGCPQRICQDINYRTFYANVSQHRELMKLKDVNAVHARRRGFRCRIDVLHKVNDVPRRQMTNFMLERIRTDLNVAGFGPGMRGAFARIRITNIPYCDDTRLFELVNGVTLIPNGDIHPADDAVMFSVPGTDVVRTRLVEEKQNCELTVALIKMDGTVWKEEWWQTLSDNPESFDCKACLYLSESQLQRLSLQNAVGASGTTMDATGRMPLVNTDLEKFLVQQSRLYHYSRAKYPRRARRLPECPTCGVVCSMSDPTAFGLELYDSPWIRIESRRRASEYYYYNVLTGVSVSSIPADDDQRMLLWRFVSFAPLTEPREGNLLREMLIRHGGEGQYQLMVDFEPSRMHSINVRLASGDKEGTAFFPPQPIYVWARAGHDLEILHDNAEPPSLPLDETTTLPYTFVKHILSRDYNSIHNWNNRLHAGQGIYTSPVGVRARSSTHHTLSPVPWAVLNDNPRARVRIMFRKTTVTCTVQLPRPGRFVILALNRDVLIGDDSAVNMSLIVEHRAAAIQERLQQPNGGPQTATEEQINRGKLIQQFIDYWPGAAIPDGTPFAHHGIPRAAFQSGVQVALRWPIDLNPNPTAMCSTQWCTLCSRNPHDGITCAVAEDRRKARALRQGDREMINKIRLFVSIRSAMVNTCNFEDMEKKVKDAYYSSTSCTLEDDADKISLHLNKSWCPKCNQGIEFLLKHRNWRSSSGNYLVDNHTGFGKREPLKGEDARRHWPSGRFPLTKAIQLVDTHGFEGAVNHLQNMVRTRRNDRAIANAMLPEDVIKRKEDPRGNGAGLQIGNNDFRYGRYMLHGSESARHFHVRYQQSVAQLVHAARHRQGVNAPLVSFYGGGTPSRPRSRPRLQGGQACSHFQHKCIDAGAVMTNNKIVSDDGQSYSRESTSHWCRICEVPMYVRSFYRYAGPVSWFIGHIKSEKVGPERCRQLSRMFGGGPVMVDNNSYRFDPSICENIEEDIDAYNADNRAELRIKTHMLRILERIQTHHGNNTPLRHASLQYLTQSTENDGYRSYYLPGHYDSNTTRHVPGSAVARFGWHRPSLSKYFSLTEDQVLEVLRAVDERFKVDIIGDRDLRYHLYFHVEKIHEDERWFRETLENPDNTGTTTTPPSRVREWLMPRSASNVEVFPYDRYEWNRALLFGRLLPRATPRFSLLNNDRMLYDYAVRWFAARGQPLETTSGFQFLKKLFLTNFRYYLNDMWGYGMMIEDGRYMAEMSEAGSTPNSLDLLDGPFEVDVTNEAVPSAPSAVRTFTARPNMYNISAPSSTENTDAPPADGPLRGIRARRLVESVQAWVTYLRRTIRSLERQEGITVFPIEKALNSDYAGSHWLDYPQWNTLEVRRSDDVFATTKSFPADSNYGRAIGRFHGGTELVGGVPWYEYSPEWSRQYTYASNTWRLRGSVNAIFQVNALYEPFKRYQTELMGALINLNAYGPAEGDRDAPTMLREHDGECSFVFRHSTVPASVADIAAFEESTTPGLPVNDEHDATVHMSSMLRTLMRTDGLKTFGCHLDGRRVSLRLALPSHRNSSNSYENYAPVTLDVTGHLVPMIYDLQQKAHVYNGAHNPGNSNQMTWIHELKRDILASASEVVGMENMRGFMAQTGTVPYDRCPDIRTRADIDRLVPLVDCYTACGLHCDHWSGRPIWRVFCSLGCVVFHFLPDLEYRRVLWHQGDRSPHHYISVCAWLHPGMHGLITAMVRTRIPIAPHPRRRTTLFGLLKENIAVRDMRTVANGSELRSFGNRRLIVRANRHRNVMVVYDAQKHRHRPVKLSNSRRHVSKIPREPWFLYEMSLDAEYKTSFWDLSSPHRQQGHPKIGLGYRDFYMDTSFPTFGFRYVSYLEAIQTIDLDRLVHEAEEIGNTKSKNRNRYQRITRWKTANRAAIAKWNLRGPENLKNRAKQIYTAFVDCVPPCFMTCELLKVMRQRLRSMGIEFDNHPLYQRFSENEDRQESTISTVQRLTLDRTIRVQPSLTYQYNGRTLTRP